MHVEAIRDSVPDITRRIFAQFDEQYVEINILHVFF
jgi:hypothetical protein